MFSGRTNLLSFNFSKEGASVLLNRWFLALLLIFPLIKIIISTKPFKRFRLFKNIKELNISLGGIGSMKITTNDEIINVAHKARTELSTRKAGLLFDEDHDVIVDIYSSRYELFQEFRKLIKEIPGNEISNDDTQSLIKILIDSLNKGLRPHLTKWQSRFRKRFKNEIEREENKNKSYQDIQKSFPEYAILIADLKIINQQLVDYTNQLKRLIK